MNYNLDRYTNLPSGRQAGDYLWILSRHAYKKARSIIKTLLHNYTLRIDETFNGLGCMNHDSRTIIINPLYYLATVDPVIDKIYDADPNAYDVVNNTLIWGFVGIVCHEIGHALYTLPAEESRKLINLQIPEKFIYFCSNVVEDSFIQDRMKARFKWDLLKDGLDTSTAMFQGHMTCEDFSKKTEYTLHDKLFYFILRSYNPNYFPPEGLDIPEDLIEDFLAFHFLPDSKQRFLDTLSWSAKVYDWLKDEIQNEPETPQDGQGNGPSTPGGSGNGPGIGSGGKMSKADIDKAIEDLVDNIVSSTGIGSGNDKTQGSLKSKDALTESPTVDVSLCNGIMKANDDNYVEFDDECRSVLSAYNLNFRRLQLYSFNGTEYNLSSGSLNKRRLYKSDFTPKIFTREIGRKRDMDLYFGITLDASGSMDDTYYTLAKIIVPLLHSLQSIHAKSEMLIFSDETVKVKDYNDKSVTNLYGSTLASNMSGGTDLLPSLRYFSSIIKERNHRDKCIIVVTDGQTNNKKACKDQIEKLRQQHCCVVGIGLNLDRNCGWFTDLFGDDCLTYPDDNSIKDNIAKDLISYLSNKFMRR